MAVSHQSPKEQRGEGFRRPSDTSGVLNAPAEPIRGEPGFGVQRRDKATSGKASAPSSKGS